MTKIRLHQIFFGLLIFFLPTQLGRHFWPDFSFIFGLRLDYLSPTLYLTDLLALATLVIWWWQERKIRNIGRVNWLIFFIFFYLFINSLLAQNQGAAFYKLTKIAEFAWLGFYVAQNTKTKIIIGKILPVVVVYSGLIALVQVFKQSSLDGFFWFLGERTFSAGTPGIALAQSFGHLHLRPYGTFSHPNSMSGFLLVALILIWGLGKNSSFWLKILVSFLGFLVIFLSFSRIVWIATLLLGLWLAVWWFGLRRKIPSQVPIYFLLTASFSIGVLIFFSGPSFFSEEATTQRINLAQVALLIIKESPLFGVGLNNFIVHLPKFWVPSGVYFLQPVHNIFLLVAAETGLIGLLVFLWFLWLMVRRLIFKGKTFLLLALGAILFTGIFDHYWLTLQQNQLLTAIVFGLSWSNQTKLGKNTPGR